MQLLRERQKTIIWVVSLIVIPSFVLLWGAGGASMFHAGQGQAVARFDGEGITNIDYFEFRKRLQAVTFGRGLRYWTMLPIRDDDGFFSSMLAISQIREAERVGLEVPDNEVGTFIRTLFPGEEPGSLDQEGFDEALRHWRITLPDYKQGVREWLLMQKFNEMLDSSALPGETTTYLRWARGAASVTLRKVLVRAAPLEKAAMEAVYPEGKSDEEILPLLRDYLDRHAGEERFLTDAKWRFEYILVPYEGIEPPEPTEEEMRALYEMESKQTGRFEGKPYEEVRDEVREAAIQARRQEMAEQTLVTEVDHFLSRTVAEGETLDPEAIAKEPTLARRGVEVGDSGASLLPTQEFGRIERVGDSMSLALFLDRIAGQPEEERAETIARLLETFDTRTPPLQNDAGVFRIRLREWEEPRPRALEGDRAFQLKVLDEVVRERAGEMAHERAEEIAARMREGEVEDLPIKEETLPAAQVPEVIRHEAPGVPVLHDVEEGTEVLVVTERSIPSRQAFEALAQEERTAFYENVAQELRGRVMPHPRAGIFFVIPGVRLQLWISNLLQSGRLRILVDREGGEGGA